MDFVWGYIKKARKPYYCDLCGTQIMQGTVYARQVNRFNTGKLDVLRRHAQPVCPYEEMADVQEEESFLATSYKLVTTQVLVRYLDGSVGIEPRTELKTVVEDDSGDLNDYEDIDVPF
ncbi:MAG: hypothetical protein JWN37_622 [Candidatus Nomurabacteria bacterium]|nr:hypothetical protein [Candidatus Nomurabacteria bacterium]